MQCLYLPVNERFEVIVKRACKMYPFTFKLFVQSLLLFFTIQIFSLFFFFDPYKCVLFMYCKWLRNNFAFDRTC